MVERGCHKFQAHTLRITMRLLLSLIALGLVFIETSACTQSTQLKSESNLRIENRHTNPNQVASGSDNSICSFLENKGNLDGSEAEIKAILITGREYTYLYDPRCRGVKEKELWYEVKSEEVNRELYSIITPENPEFKRNGLIRVMATFRGILRVSRDKGFGPDGYYTYKLEIQDAFNISPVADDVPYPWQ